MSYQGPKGAPGIIPDKKEEEIDFIINEINSSPTHYIGDDKVVDIDSFIALHIKRLLMEYRTTLRTC
jgi:hypothetical protein